MRLLLLARSPRAAALSLIVALAVLGSACGADDDVDVDAGAGNGSGPLECPAKAGPAAETGNDVRSAIEGRGKPKVRVPADPATELCIVDDLVGSGEEVPEGASVTIHYVGVGQQTEQEFDSSWESGEPTTLPLTSLIEGWKQGIPGMKVGGRRTLVIPADLAYGDTPQTPKIKAGETLVFVIDLVGFTPPIGPCPGATDGPTSAGGDDVLDEITKRGKPTPTIPDEPATALCYIDEIIGAGAAVPAGATVTIHYVGVGQQTKQEFDASWGSEPATFPLGNLIPGWQQGIPGMKVGGRRTLIIPGELGYGANPGSPSIQPNETLVFTIDLVAFQ
jgi:peptidylprolyl isomerase